MISSVYPKSWPSLIWDLETPAAALVRAIYPNMQGRYRHLEYLSERAILAPRNDNVDLLNGVASDAFPGVFVELLSQDFIDDEETQGAALYPTEFLDSIHPPSLPPHRLLLKEGQPILLLRNLDPKSGLCNGTRLICTRIGRRVIEAEIMTGGAANQRAFIPRITLKPTDNGGPSIEFSRRQFPVRPAFAFTINKAQGQTLKAVGIYLSDHVFFHGQLYVALSDALIQTISALQFIQELYPARAENIPVTLYIETR